MAMNKLPIQQQNHSVIPITPDPRSELLSTMDSETRALCEATGTSHGDSAQQLFDHLMIALPQGMNDPYTLASTRQLLQELAPKDPLEGLLSIQMLALHSLAIDQMAHSNQAKSPEQQDGYRKTAMQASSLFGKHLERLASYRKKGTQTIQVQHVYVNAGGQAIVSNLQQNQTGGME